MMRIENYVIDKKTLPIFLELCSREAAEGFGELSLGYGALAVTDGGEATPVGVILAHPVEYDLMLDWIYVHKDYRRQGIAAGLLVQLLDACDALPNIDNVMAYICDGEDDLRGLCDSMGFQLLPLEGKGQFVSRISEMIDLGKVPTKLAQDCKLLSRVPSGALRIMESELYESASDDIMQGVAFPIHAEDYSPYSMAVYDGKKVKALILLKETQLRLNPEDADTTAALDVAWLYSKSKDGKSLLLLLSTVVDRIKADHPDIPVVFTSLNEISMGLGEKLFRDADFRQYRLAYMSF